MSTAHLEVQNHDFMLTAKVCHKDHLKTIRQFSSVHFITCVYTRRKTTILFTETSNYAAIVMFRRQCHSATLMSKYSVSEHLIQNLVHSAQSIALDPYKFHAPNSQLVRAHTKNVTMTHFS